MGKKKRDQEGKPKRGPHPRRKVKPKDWTNRAGGQWGGPRPNAGRPKGSLNKVNNQIKEALRPLEVAGNQEMLELMRNVKTDPSLKLRIWELTLAYRHGRPAQRTELTTPPDQPFQLDWLTFLTQAHQIRQERSH